MQKEQAIKAAEYIHNQGIDEDDYEEEDSDNGQELIDTSNKLCDSKEGPYHHHYSHHYSSKKNRI